MRILVIGSTAKEHAIIWKLHQGESLEEVFCAPGNFGTEKLATNIEIRPFEIKKLVDFALENQIDLTIATDKVALDSGVVDAFYKAELAILGPEKAPMRAIMQRSFAKKFFYKHKIPSPKFAVFDRENQAIDHARKVKYPIIVKLNTPTPDINSFYCETFTQAKNIIERAFLNLNKRIIIEEYKEGKELALPVITDGYNALPMPACVIYRRLLEGDGAAWTNGIGAYSHNFSIEQEEFIAQNIVFPAIDGFNADKMPYSGILTFRLRELRNGTFELLELDSDFSGVEAQTTLPLVDEEFSRLLYSTTIGALGDDYRSIHNTGEFSASVMFTQKPYPADFEKGNVITIEDEIDDDLLIFYNKVKQNIYFEKIVDGGQVLSLTSTGSTLSNSLDKLYTATDYIDFEGKRFRKDIGQQNLVGA